MRTEFNKLDGCPGTTCQARMTLKLTLTFGLPEQMSQIHVAYLHMMEKDFANLYGNPSKIVLVMVWTNKK